MAKKYLIKRDVTLQLGTQTLRYRAGQRKVLDDRIAKLLKNHIQDVDEIVEAPAVAEEVAPEVVEESVASSEGTTETEDEALAEEEITSESVEEIPDSEESEMDSEEDSEEETPVEDEVASEDEDEEVTENDHPEYEDLKKSEWITYGEKLEIKWSAEDPRDLNKRAVYAEVMAFLEG